MTSRDRLVVMVIALLAVLGIGWIAVVSPERSKASKLQSEIASASSTLAGAESQLSGARAAQARYASEYASIVRLGKAVPPGREVPALVYDLARASERKHVDLSSIVYGASGGPSGTSSVTAALENSTANSASAFAQLPFTFVFNGSFGDLYNLFKQLNRLTDRSASGSLQVNGRLLTIQSLKLAPVTNSISGTGPSEEMSGTITASAYVLPASQSLTGGATSSSPAGAGSASSGTGGASSSTAPAVVRVAP